MGPRGDRWLLDSVGRDQHQPGPGYAGRTQGVAKSIRLPCATNQEFGRHRQDQRQADEGGTARGGGQVEPEPPGCFDPFGNCPSFRKSIRNQDNRKCRARERPGVCPRQLVPVRDPAEDQGGNRGSESEHSRVRPSQHEACEQDDHPGEGDSCPGRPKSGRFRQSPLDE